MHAAKQGKRGNRTSYLGSSSLAETLRPACCVGSVEMDKTVPTLSEVFESGPFVLHVSLHLTENEEETIADDTYLRRACSGRSVLR